MSCESSPDGNEAKVQHFAYVVLGGGIAGVTCTETLSLLCPEDNILLITASPLVKTITNFNQITKTLEEFDIKEESGDKLQQKLKNTTVIFTRVTSLTASNKTLQCSNGQTYSYCRLCLCCGGIPKIIAQNPLVFGIRDTETVNVFQQKLAGARRIIVVGNGGIATEIVYEIEGCEVIWAIKDKNISSTFVDGGASKFLLSKLYEDKEAKPPVSKRLKYTHHEAAVGDSSSSDKASVMGSALGPDWMTERPFTGQYQTSHNVHVEYLVEVAHVHTPEQYSQAQLKHTHLKKFIDRDDWPVYVELTNGSVYGCDFIVSATGVTPNTQPFLQGNDFKVAEDGGVCVSNEMLTSEPDIYAAGDMCHAAWEHSPNWIQMRLWSQARQMGLYAAKCMRAHQHKEEISLDFCFELFAHITKFFNYKVVLLGKFNGQGLPEHDLLLRTTPGMEYIKAVMYEGRMHGAVLIGETDMEETFENLILNQMDLSQFGEDLLDPGIDLEDFFD